MLNFEQLSNLSDAELDRLAAERVMGWTYQLGLGRPADYAIYADGQGGGYFVSSYTPTTDRNQSGDLLTAMVGRGAQFMIAFDQIQGGMDISVSVPNGRGGFISGNSPRSETIAALLAWQALEGGKTNPGKP